MRKCRWLPALTLLLVTAASAYSQNGPAENAITEEEYGIYRLALGKPLGRSTVDEETLAGVRADDDWLTPPAKIPLAPDLVKAFNEKNAKKYRLSDAFLQETAHDSGNGPEGRKKTTFSRVAFDENKRQALLIVGTAWYHPEDVMNEGRYVLLEKKGGHWTIVATARAWDMRLGPID